MRRLQAIWMLTSSKSGVSAKELERELGIGYRAGGEREALRALTAAREDAVNAKRAGLCQLRDLLVTAPEPLRSELRPLRRARLLRRFIEAL
jgi:transposase